MPNIMLYRKREKICIAYSLRITQGVKKTDLLPQETMGRVNKNE
jgi:hypothetical protein